MRDEPPKQQKDDFSDRVDRIRQTHQAMSRGFVYEVQEDGLIRPRVRRRWRFSIFRLLRAIILVVAVVYGIKLILFYTLGEEEFGKRLSQLERGNMIERAGAALMRPDPLTDRIITFVPNPFLNP